MARKKRVYTPMQTAYRKQIARLRKYERQILKEGGTLPEVHQYTDMPKRVTKQMVAKLKAIKPKSIRKKAEFLEDGETIDWFEKQRRKKERQEKQDIIVDFVPEGEKVASIMTQIRMAIDNFWDQVNSMPKGVDEVFRGWFASLLFQLGNVAVGYYLLTMSPDLAEKWQSTGYDYKQAMSLIESELYSVLDSKEYATVMEMLDRGAADAWEDV